jgi:hypothetical protein
MAAIFAVGCTGAAADPMPALERRMPERTFRRTEYWTSADHTTRAAECLGPSRCTGERTVCHGPPTRFVTTSWEACDAPNDAAPGRR